MSTLPKRTRQHVIEEESRQFVKGILPTEWIVEDGQHDYGIDLVVEIVIDEQVTGAHFLMQLKGTDELTIREGGYIAHNCSTSALRYYLERPELIIYLVYDTVQKKGYWVWIQDFIRGLGSGWQSQKTVTVQIPLTNVFDTNALEEITPRVLKSHKQLKWLTATQTAQNPYFRYDFETIGQGFQINIHPRYFGAAEDCPVEVKGVFKFDKSPDAQAAFQVLDTAIKTGTPAEIDSRFFEGFGPPEAFSDLFAHLGKIQPNKIKIGFARSNGHLNAKILILDQEGGQVAEIPYVDFRVVQAGTEEVTLSNQEQDVPIKLSLRINFKDYTTVTIGVRIIYSAGVNVVQIQKLMRIQLALAQGGQVVVIDLGSDLSMLRGSVPPGSMAETDEILARLVDDLVFIQGKTQQLFQWPQEISVTEALLTRQLVEVLRTGRSQKKMPTVELEVPKLKAQNLALAYTANNGEMQIGFDSPDDIVNLFGTEVSLGPNRTIIPYTKPTAETLRAFQELDQLPDDTLVKLTLEVGEQGVLSYYFRWLPQA